MRLIATALLLVLLPLAHAGTAEDPEVSDAGGDSVSTVDGLGAAGADLLKGWYTEDGDNVLFHFESGGMCADSTETIEYRWQATAGGSDVAFGADLFGQGGLCFSGEDDTTITPTGAATAASFTGAVATLTVPRTAFGDGSDGTVLSTTFGTSKAYVGDPGAWNDSDRAPDDGGGRDYVLGGVVEDQAPVTQVINVTEPELQHTQSSSEPLDAAFLLHWEGPANVTLSLSVAGTGNVTIDVLDPTGGSQFQCMCGDTNESMALVSEPGTWTVNITYEGFVGNASLRLSATPSDGPEPDTGSPDDGNATDEPSPGGNGTDEGSASDGEDSPMPAVLAVLALTFVAWRRR